MQFWSDSLRFCINSASNRKALACGGGLQINVETGPVGQQQQLAYPHGVVFDGWFAPSRIEVDVHDLEIEGRIPEGLEGAYYKVAADPHYPPMLGKTIYLDGDGMVTVLRLQNGHADLKTRYVCTPAFPGRA